MSEKHFFDNREDLMEKKVEFGSRLGIPAVDIGIDIEEVRHLKLARSRKNLMFMSCKALVRSHAGRAAWHGFPGRDRFRAGGVLFDLPNDIFLP